MRTLLALLLSAGIASAELPLIAFEAEDYSEVTGGEVRILDRPEASGGKCVSYWEEPGVAVTCEFEVAEAGEYCLTLGYALQWPDTRREVRVDGEVVPGLEDVLLPGTGTWADFGAVTLAAPGAGRVRITLEPGTHTLTLTNVDSRGLAWDYAVLHDPAMLFADVPLSDEELREFADALPATSRRLLLEGAAAGDLAVGDVAVAFHGGMAQALRVGDAFFAIPRDLEVPIEWEHHQVEGLGLATISGVPEEGHRLRGVLVTNGLSLVLVMAGTGPNTMSGGRAAGLPSPLLIWRDGQPWLLALGAVEQRLNAEEGERTLDIGGAVVSANDRIRGDLIAGEVPWLQISWAPTAAGDLKVAAGKIGPPLAPADTRVHVAADGADLIIRSATDMPPALAQFYGIPQFEVRVHPDVSMTVTTDAGQRLELPAP